MDETAMNGHHGIAEHEWFAYLEGTLPPAHRARLSAHLDTCAPCCRLLHQIRAWEEKIEEEARCLVLHVERQPHDLDRMAAEMMGRIRNDAPRALATRGMLFAEAVRLLQSVLDPLCGKGAAANAVRMAAERSGGWLDRRLSAERWPVFVRNLGEGVGAVYGVPAQLLIERVGALVAAEVE